MPDPRAVLGVDRYASIEECRKAYRTLAKKHHPDVDKTPGATKRMAEITAAWTLVQKLPQPVRPKPRPAPVRHPLNTERTHGGNVFTSSSSANPAGFYGIRFYEGPLHVQPDQPPQYSDGPTPAEPITEEMIRQAYEATMRMKAQTRETFAQQFGMPQWDDGSIKVPAADFTGDACDFRMPGGLYEGQKLGDILRDHEWYGEEIDQYPIGDPIRALFRDAKRHLEREKKGRPVHEW